MRRAAGVIAVCLIASAAPAQQMPSEDAAMFARFPSGPVFHGKPAKPVVIDHDAHLFRTQIRMGAARGVVFAGHYEIASWGCGTGCSSFAVINALNGRVTFFPYSVSQVREAGNNFAYRKDSRAIHVIGSLNEENSADRWFVWDGQTFRLISEKPAKILNDPAVDPK
jgi:hypothetical protein